MRVLYTLEPTGWTGGRAYLRMIHTALAGAWDIRTIPDHKRSYSRRRWRKLRHLAALAPAIHRLRDADAGFVWDDLSLLWFTPTMRRRTIFVFHHHEPRQYDSAPIEPWLWHRLFTALRDCHTVVCVAPYWRRYLAQRGIHATVIYNAFDLDPINTTRAEDHTQLRAQLGLPADRTLVYVGKAVHWKGVDLAHQLLGHHPDLCLISTGNNTIGARTHHTGWLPYPDHLRTIRACDVGLFLPQMREGWSRCAAEAILLGLPCILANHAGLGDLRRHAGQHVPDLTHLADQVRHRAHAPAAETDAARHALAQFDRTYFTDQWRSLLNAVNPPLRSHPAEPRSLQYCENICPILRTTGRRRPSLIRHPGS